MRNSLCVGMMMVALVTGSALAHGNLVLTPVQKARHSSMSAMSAAMKELSLVARLGTPVTDFTLEKARSLAELSAGIAAQFPEGSGGGDSRARDRIWQDWPAYSAEIDKAKNATSALLAALEQGATGGDLTGAFTDVAASCKSCHQRFRAPEH